ncbi:MAG TPA: hypothetical protein VF407_20260 [Polyangiaceae bacterium]
MTKLQFAPIVTMSMVLAATAACSKDKTEGATPTPSASAVVDAGPTQPVVTLDLTSESPRAWNVTAERLPAVSEDGTQVAILVTKEDGTRQYANAAVEIHTVADDKIAASVPILEADSVVAAEGAPDAFHTTIPAYKTTANAKLTEATALLAKTKWTALNAKLGQAPVGDAGAPSLLVSGFGVALKPAEGGKLSLVMARATDKDMATPLLTQDVSAFQIATRKPPTPQKGNPMCVFTPFVAETAVDGVHHVLVVRVGQAVKDDVYGCFEASQWHVYPFKG